RIIGGTSVRTISIQCPARKRSGDLRRLRRSFQHWRAHRSTIPFLPDGCQATIIRQRNYVGLPLAFWLKYFAPALWADFPFNRCAGARRLKEFALVALLVAFRRVLVSGLLLRHLGLCCRGLWAQGEEDSSIQGSSRRPI